MSYRNNENILPQQPQVMLKRASVFGVQHASATVSSGVPASMLHEPKKMALPSKPRMSRAPLTSIQSKAASEVPQQQELKKSASPQSVPSTPVTTEQGKMIIPKRRTYQMESPGIDLPDVNNPQQVCEIVKDIIEHNKDNELKYHPDPVYMEKQPKITAPMRAVLVDWLVDVHRRYKTCPETIFLTVNIMDRYLSHRQVQKSKFQLIGVTAMLIACKYEEIDYPDVASIEKICARAVSRSELLSMERAMLAQLEFNITVVTCYPFLSRYCKCGKLDKQQEWLALYFAELTLLDVNFLKFPPSVIAATAIYLSNRFVEKQDPWCDNLKYYTGYELEDIRPCVVDLLVVIKEQRNANLKQHALRSKYLSPTRMEVGQIVLSRAHMINV